MRVLLIAYSARAGHGSEPAMGWGWTRYLAEAGHRVTVLTHARNEADDRDWLQEHPLPSLTMVYLDSGRVGAAMRQAVPGERLARVIEYIAWRRAAWRSARRLHRETPFDVVHHVTYSSILLGSPVCRLGIPFVFGPLGAGQRAPTAAKELFGKQWPQQQLRNAVIAATAAGFNPLASASVRRANAVLATNDATLRVARRLGAGRIELMADTGVDPARIGTARSAPNRDGAYRVFWVGRLAPRKAPRLAVEAVARAAREIDVELHFAGDGPERARLQQWAAELGIADRVHLHGRVPWSEVMDLYAGSDAFLFTSVQESLGSQLVEAAAFGLPIVTVDLHGASSILPEAAAVKVPFAGIDTTATELARALIRVLTDEATYASLSQGAIDFARSETWPEHVRRVEPIYADVVRRDDVVT